MRKGDDQSPADWVLILSNVEVLLNYLEVERGRNDQLTPLVESLGILYQDKLSQSTDNRSDLPIGKDGQPIVEAL